jgi:outer membrane protein assembly factor BamB
LRPAVVRPQQFLWAFPQEPPFEDEALPMRNAPAVDALGRIFLATQGRLSALVEEEGKAKVIWDYMIGSHVPGRIVAASDGSVRAHAADGLLHAVTPEGKQAFPPVQVGEPLGWAAPVVDPEGNTWISAYDGGLIRVNAQGRMAAQRYFRSRRKFDSAAVIAGGVLYVGSEEGYLFALDVTGDRGRNLWNHAVDQGFTGGFVNSSPAVTADGAIVVASRDEMLFSFSPSGGTLWSVRLPGQMLGSPVIDAGGHVYVGVSQAQRGQEPHGMLVCVDGNSHQIRWQYTANAAVESTPVAGDDGVIYFGDNAGTIHAVDDGGTARWTARVESAVRSAGTILAPGRLAFGLDDDTLVVLACSSQGLAKGWPKLGRTAAQTGT